MVHHERLAPGLRELLRDEAADDVGGAAGRERNDEANRLGGVLLRAGRGACKRQHRSNTVANGGWRMAKGKTYRHCVTSSPRHYIRRARWRAPSPDEWRPAPPCSPSRQSSPRGT